MDRSIRLSEFLFVIAMILVAFIAGSFTASFVAASQVEHHIDDTIAKTVQNSISQSRKASDQFQQLVEQVNAICQSLKKEGSPINCGSGNAQP